VIYGYKGLIGRGPILVHLSLIIILGGSALGAFKNSKRKKFYQRRIISYSKYNQVGWVTSIPPITTRVNDFWVEYENNSSILFKFINFRCIWER
jgi:cytochrome c biogenesis protein ResB